MQALRLIVWVLITAAFVFFMSLNYGEPVPVRFWPLRANDNLLFEWPVAIIALVFFLLGFIPTWLFQRAVRWRLQRRIAQLETTQRATANAIATPTTVPPPPSPAPLAPEPVPGAPVPRDDILG